MPTMIFAQRIYAFISASQNRLFLRFLAVGVLNTIFGYGLFSVLLYMGNHYAIATLISTLAGVLFNFKTTGKLVFGSHDNGLIFRFIGTYLVIYLTNITGLRLLTLVGVNPYVGGALLLLPLAALAFILNKRFVFHHG